MVPVLRRVPRLAALPLVLTACIGGSYPASPTGGAGHTITSLSSSGSTVPHGEPVILTATVSPPEATGTVTFLDGTNAIGAASLGTGTATLSITSLGAGAHTLTASYDGSPRYAASRSAAIAVLVSSGSDPERLPTTAALASSAVEVSAGAPVTLTATVSPREATGTVTFLDGANAIGSASLGSGTATLSTTALAVGSHTLTATYGGSSRHGSSRSDPVAVTVTGSAPVTTTTTLASSAASVTAGASVILTATVSPAAATGTVTFRDGTNAVGTASLGSGAATLSTTSLAAGAHTLTASYGGDARHAASRSASVAVTVNAAGEDCGKVGNFSFFVTSWAALKRLSGNANGFGGNLRYPDPNDTSPGAGLKGADRICAAIADSVEPGSSSCKTWRAFLSAAAGENGTQVNAIDRVGPGPWYDRNGRLFARSKADLPNQRPLNCDPVICWDFPNETGTLNHNPDGTGNVDNHDMLTGSDAQGTLLDRYATCGDWTMNTYDSRYRPMCGHPWPTPGMERARMGNWISAIPEGGCVPGFNFDETINFPGGELGKTVGASGGYGGFYCFAILR